MLNFDQLLKLYFKNVSDRLEPYRREIYQTLKLEPLVNIKSSDFPEGSNSNNRLKYFDQKRPYFVCKVISNISSEFPGGKLKILDIGCGIGDFSAMFNALGYEAVGINAGDTWYIEDFRYCCDLLKITVAYLDISKRIPFRDKQFDIVFASEILTLGSLIDKQASILEELNRISKQIIVVNHHNRKLTYNKIKYSQFSSPEV